MIVENGFEAVAAGLNPPPNPTGEAVLAMSANERPDLAPNIDSIVLRVVWADGGGCSPGFVGVCVDERLNGWKRLVLPNVIFEVFDEAEPNWIELVFDCAEPNMLLGVFVVLFVDADDPAGVVDDAF